MREVVITGLGLVSCAGEGVAAHLAALRPGFSPPLERGRFAPYAIQMDWPEHTWPPNLPPRIGASFYLAAWGVESEDADRALDDVFRSWP